MSRQQNQRIRLLEVQSLTFCGLAFCLALATGCATGRGGDPGPSMRPASPAESAPSTPARQPPPVATSAEPSADGCPLCLDPSSPKIREIYSAAIEDAIIPKRSAIVRDLLPLLPSTEGLIWNEQGQILMSSWTKAAYFLDPVDHQPGVRFTLPVDMWLTPAPIVQSFCRELGLDGPMLDLRLEQLIGLPPGRGKDAFVEFWADPQDLFRPCPDPEISDHECQVEIPVIDRSSEQPWDCTLRRQVSGKYVTVHPGHLRWMCDIWAGSYGHQELYDNYPFTALGYTYDWGNPKDHRGLSEYVAPRGSTVVFHRLLSTEQNCSK